MHSPKKPLPSEQKLKMVKFENIFISEICFIPFF